MKILVISLPESAERRQSATGKLTTLGLSFEFIDGINGSTSRDPLLKRYREREFILNYGRPALPGELGCYASHYLAWQRCIELGEPVLVLEDDFKPLENFMDALALCEQHINAQGYIRLETTGDKPASTVFTQDGFTLVKFLKAPQGALCYAISPSVARIFVARSQTFDYPVDVFVRNFWYHKVPLFGLKPYSATASKIAVKSYIGSRRGHYPKSLGTRLHRSARKLKALLKTGIENLRYKLGLRK
ncbi:MAG: glycosyltransferase family 25 protein [Gammaproteobacteria bacterium]|jgi:glycosyl transferase family 25|nr:glycosyltransferase family 25 protein [Gammaproteobacteria bacterium]